MDFRARIIAELDKSKAQSQLKELTKEQKVELAVDVAIKNAQALKNLKEDATSLQNKLKKINFTIDTKQAVQAIKQVEKEAALAQKQMLKKQQSVNSAYYKQFFENDFSTQHTKSSELKEMAKYYTELEKEAAAAQKQMLKKQQSVNAAYYKQFFDNDFATQHTKSDQLKEMANYYAELEKEAIKAQKQIDKINKEASSGLFQYRDSKNQSFLDKYVGQNSEALSRAKSQIEEINRLQSKILSGDLEGNSLISTYEKLNSEVEKLGYSMKQVANEQTKTLAAGVADTSANRVKAYAESNSKALSKYRAELESLENAYRSITTQGEKLNLDNQFRNLQSRISADGLTGKSNFAEFKRAMGQIAEFAGVYGLIQNVAFEVPRQLIQAVQDIDAAQIELLKVSDAPQVELTAYWDQAADSAKKYGATVSDVIQSTADWSRLGYNLEDSKILSDITTLYEKVGDNMTQESASESLVSTLQGFQLTADQAEHIVDAFNEVGNNFAIGSDGIGEALQRSASSMYAAGNTMEQTIGLVTAANTVVQDPASVGTAFKTISMRIRGAKTELEDAGLETDGMANSTAELREELMALSGVDIMKDSTTFKSTYDILDELASKWKDLTDIQQASVTELIAGKRQGNVISALMSNFDIARQATETAYNSDGSAQKELQNLQKGIEYSIGQFKAQFQELSTTLLDSSIFKGVIDGGTTFLNILTQIADAGNGVVALLGTIGGVAIFKNLDWGKSSHIFNFQGESIAIKKIA